MKTETYQIARAGHASFDLSKGAVARIVHKDGAQFKGKADLTVEDGALVFAYADGTSVSLSL